MLKRGREIARAVAESAGILPPRVIDATEAAEQHRASLVAAQAALEEAGDALQAAHDRGAPLGEITHSEAVLAAAKQEASRAEAKFLGAERRLRAAQAAAAESAKAAALAALEGAFAIRRRAAARIDAAAREAAEAVAEYDSTLNIIAEARRAGVATNSAPVSAQRLAEHAFERAGAVPSHWMGDLASQPTATELAERDEGAIRIPALPPSDAELQAASAS